MLCSVMIWLRDSYDQADQADYNQEKPGYDLIMAITSGGHWAGEI